MKKGLVFFVLVMLLTSCGSKRQALNLEDMRKDMVAFDQVYIPALSFTSLEKLGPSKQSMLQVVSEWKAFKQKYENANVKDGEWKKDFKRLDSLIVDADEALRSGTNLIVIHDKYLESVRDVFMTLREHNGLTNYFIDSLTRFHTPMESIVLSAKGKTPDTLTQEDIKKMRVVFPVAKERFADIQNTAVDPELFGLDDPEVLQIQILISNEAVAMVDLEQALQKDDKQDIIKTAVGIKAGFTKLFKAFGHF